MARFTKRALATAAGIALLSGTLAACGSDDGDEPGGSEGEGAKGGTLFVKMEDPIEKWDPQRTYIGLHINVLARTVTRGLLTSTSSKDPDAISEPIPDIATDTGTMEDGGKQWSFTIRDGVTWEDGEPVTCEDFKYGYSRNFATDQITDGPAQYPLSFTDIPGATEGEPQYKGPYSGEGQELYDKAVTCDGNTITYRFNKPFPDFDLAVASLHFAAPYREDKDRGGKGLFDIISNGPYKLEAPWDKNSGGTFVRNPEYGNDDTGTRNALPDKIVFQVGDSAETYYEELVADNGDAQNTIPFNRMPSTMYPQIETLEGEDRYLGGEDNRSPFTAYVWFNQETLDLPVRKALAVSTNREAWINASGGDRKYLPADSIVQSDTPGYAPNSIWKDVPPEGDPDQAKQILEEAGVQTPVKIEFHYPQSEDADKQARALQDTWNKTGLFEVSLDPEGDVYYTNIQKPTHDYDLGWAGWGTDWPSPSTVFPTLFDGRINIQGDTVGNDYAKYDSDEYNKLMDEAAALTGEGNLEEAYEVYQEADTLLAEDAVYFPLDNELFNYTWGSNVDFHTTPASAAQPDLGLIGLKNP